LTSVTVKYATIAGAVAVALTVAVAGAAVVAVAGKRSNLIL